MSRAAVIEALVALVLLVAGAALLRAEEPAPAPALLLDHDTLTTLARTKEPELRISYKPGRVEFRTRRSVLVGWVDVLLSARFERVGRRIQLVAKSLHAGPLGEQRGKRFEEARAGLARLVNVESAATRVEVWRADPKDPRRRERVYAQEIE